MRLKKRRLIRINKKQLKIIVSALAVIVVFLVILFVTSAGRERAQKQAAVDSVAARGVINIGLRGDIDALCTYNEETGTFEGLEKDIADEIASRFFGQDILVNYVLVTSETKDALLINGDLDIAFGASIEGSASGINYSSAYYSDGAAFLVMEGAMTSEDGLDGGIVAVVQGSFAESESEDEDYDTKLEAYLGAHDIDAAVEVYASYQEAVEALRLGFVDGVCANEIFLKIYGKAGMLLLSERFMPHPYCVEVSKLLGVFCDAVDDTLRDMQKDGTLDALIEKWDLFDYALLEE
ncbi:MAG: transporter substrate-binding domain-containing protein [Eubacteriales bacterium]|nr:transporter substrate-binding domain-containing protein [Eubacteriales bacterium]